VDCVVGIDLSGISGGTHGRTAMACVALEDPLRVAGQCVVPRGMKGDRLMLAWIEERRPRVVAIDAPLSLPHSLGCELVDCPRCEPGAASYLARRVDKLVGGMPTVMLAAIAFRGIYLARVLRQRGYEVVETYPSGSYRAMGAAGKSDEERARLIGRRLGDLGTADHDCIDAACAALAAADYASGRAGIIEDDGQTICLVGQVGA
jgi:predicted nuclease with RNAse H fold